MSSSRELFELIMSDTASVNIIRKFKKTLSKLPSAVHDRIVNDLLIAAAQKGRIRLCELLLQYGADVNYARSSDGLTPLWAAIQKIHPDTVNLLLRWGADRYITLSFSDTPFEYIQQLMDEINDTNNYSMRNIYSDLASRRPSYRELKDDEFLANNSNTNNSNTNNSNTNNSNTNNSITNDNSNNNYNYISLNESDTSLHPSINLPPNSPRRCFDPIMAEDADITNDMTIIYIMNDSGIIQSVGCIDDETLDYYKSATSYLFFRCKDTVRMYESKIKQEDVQPGAIRLLNFAMRIYVKDAQAQKLQYGKKYIVRPIGNLGRIVSYDVLMGGELESSNHCGPADGSKLYEIKEITQTTGGKRRFTKRIGVRTTRIYTIRKKRKLRNE